MKLAGLMAAILLTSCSRGDADRPPDVETPAAVRGVQPEDTATNQEKSVASAPADDLEAIQRHMHQQHGLEPSDVKIKIHDKVKVPDLTVFAAEQRSGRGRNGTYTTGVVHRGKVITDEAEAMQTVLRAWGYGEKRTVPPEHVAAVLGVLEAEAEPSQPIVTEKDLAFYKEVGRPAYAAVAFVPRETTVDGLPAVQYCNRSGRPPFWITTLIIRPDSSVERRFEQPPP